MIALGFLIFKSVIAGNIQVFVNQIVFAFFFLKLRSSCKLDLVSPSILPYAKCYMCSTILFSSKLSLFLYLLLILISYCPLPQIFKWEEVRPNYLCLSLGLDTG